ncbi:MAG: hypothetical protein MJ124_06060 [Lachnospiraceae bacterium]|nr:hypothetical protein [Lachnospiraceae bacterium]
MYIVFGAIIVGLLVALIGTGALKSELHSVEKKTQANNYMVSGSLNVVGKNEIFLYSKIEKKEKPKSDN